MNLKKEFGTVFVSFKIDTIGNMYDIKIGKSDNKNLNGEALRLTKLIPNEWKPAELGGGKKRIKVLSKYYLPIRKTRECSLLRQRLAPWLLLTVVSAVFFNLWLLILMVTRLKSLPLTRLISSGR